MNSSAQYYPLASAVFYALACFDVFAGSSETQSLTERSSNINTMHAQSLAGPTYFQSTLVLSSNHIRQIR